MMRTAPLWDSDSDFLSLDPQPEKYFNQHSQLLEPLNSPDLEAEASENTDRKPITIPIPGTPYPAPKEFQCPSVESSGSDEFCGYENQRYYVCQRGCSHSCYLGQDTDVGGRYSICAHIPRQGRVCVDYSDEPGATPIHESDLELWGGKGGDAKQPDTSVNKYTESQEEKIRCSMQGLH